MNNRLCYFYFGGKLSYLVVGHLQQVQHDFMSSHILQQPLLLLPNTSTAHFVQPLQDLQRTEDGQSGVLLDYKTRSLKISYISFYVVKSKNVSGRTEKGFSFLIQFIKTTLAV